MVVVVTPSSVVARAAAVGTLPSSVAVVVGTLPSGGNDLANFSSVCQFLVTEVRRATRPRPRRKGPAPTSRPRTRGLRPDLVKRDLTASEPGRQMGERYHPCQHPGRGSCTFLPTLGPRHR